MNAIDTPEARTVTINLLGLRDSDASQRILSYLELSDLSAADTFTPIGWYNAIRNLLLAGQDKKALGVVECLQEAQLQELPILRMIVAKVYASQSVSEERRPNLELEGPPILSRGLVGTQTALAYREKSLEAFIKARVLAPIQN